MKYAHTGSVGDILYSLYAILEASEYQRRKGVAGWRPELTIVYGKTATPMPAGHPSGNVIISKWCAEWLAPLVRQLMRCDVSPNMPRDARNMSAWRETTRTGVNAYGLNLSVGDIREWHYIPMATHLQHELWKPLWGDDRTPLISASRELAGKVAVCITDRYLNAYVDTGAFLRHHAGELVYLGTRAEYNRIKAASGADIQYRETHDAYEACALIKGARGYVGNLSGMYAIAETAKVARVLIPPYYMPSLGGRSGFCNVQPMGGWYELATTTARLELAYKAMVGRESDDWVPGALSIADETPAQVSRRMRMKKGGKA